MNIVEYDYYAFISYSRTDEKWAKWVQRKLETYRFPKNLRKENQHLPEKIFPICRDKTDLRSGILQEELKYQLEKSRYLIVVCSPNSRKSAWVGQEITHFQNLGRKRNIIPLIIEGKPHAQDSTSECYHEALLHDTSEEILGVDVHELGRNKAILRIIATLMDLRFDQLVMRNKRRMLKQRIVCECLLTIFLTTAAGILWYELPHSDYYWNYVYQNEIPAGLSSISSTQRKTAHDYYKITTRKNKVIRLERINSFGSIAYNNVEFATDEFPICEFSYDGDGALHTVVQKDATGNAQLVKKYSKDLGAVDFKNPKDETAVGKLPSNLGTDQGIDSLVDESAQKSEIVRQLMEYDENGYLIQELYMWDERNTAVCDENGIYGKRYSRDEAGRIIQITNLGKDGMPLRMQHGTPVAYIQYNYNEYDRITGSYEYDADKNPVYNNNQYFSRRIHYNQFGCADNIQFFGSDGNLCTCNDGFSQIQAHYDKHGFLTQINYFDSSKKAAYTNGNGIHQIFYEYDKRGRISNISFYDANGNRMSTHQGFASESITYDDRNRVTQIWNYGINGELTYALDGNYAGYTIDYDDANCIKKWTYYNTDREIAINKNGAAIYVEKQNKQGFLEEERFFNEMAKPACTRLNAASITYRYDHNGHLISKSFFDENGDPCNNSSGISVIQSEYDDNGNQISEQYSDSNGEFCYIHIKGEDINYSKWEADYDDYGNLTCMRYLGLDGESLLNNGVYEERQEYDDRGNCIRYAYYNYQNQLMNDLTGCAVKELSYNEYGDVISEQYFDKDGSYVKDQIYAVRRKFNQKGMILSETTYTSDKNGNQDFITKTYEYDKFDDLIKTCTYGKNNCLCKDQDGVAIYEYSFNDKKRLSSIAYFDENHKRVNSKINAGAALTKVFYRQIRYINCLIM